MVTILKFKVENKPITMTVEKVAVVGEGAYERGYDAGYSVGETVGYSKGQVDGIEQGKQAEYDRFWDTFQQNGKRTMYHYAFTRWADECYNPKHPVCPVHAGEMFAASEITDIYKNGTVIVDFSKTYAMSATFQNANKLKALGIIDMRKVTSNTYYTFASNSLEKIEKIILTDNGQPKLYVQTFQSAYKLADITFEGTIFDTVSFTNSPLLTAHSIQSIIDHLKDLTGATAQTVQFHSDVILRMTAEQADAITAKNWIF